MRRVAHKRDAPDGPSRKRVAVVERPSIGRLDCADDRAHLRMPSFELLQRIRDFALGGPRLDAPFAGSDGDPVVITRAGADVVVDEVMAGTPPRDGRHLDSQVRDAIRGNQPAIGDVSGESRRLRAHDGFAHCRVNAVGADDHVSIGGRAVMELHLDAVAVLSELDASMVEMQHAVGHGR